MEFSATKLLENLEKCTSMYVPERKYIYVVIFIDGMNSALSGSLLFGLEEWLQIKLGKKSPFRWSGIILEILSFPPDINADFTAEDQKKILEGTFSILRDFFIFRNSNAALADMFIEYSRLSTN